MTLIQILALIFCLFALWRVIGKFNRHELKLGEFIIWLFFWLAVAVAFILPAITTKFANLLGIGRGADLVLYLAVLVVFYLLFRIFVRLEKMEQALTKLVRRDTLIQTPKNNDKK